MAVYNSMADGNAPKGLKVGDLVKTPKGGTWQIMNPNIYKNMTSDQLKSAGVNYNPVNGYYSKLYTGGDENYIQDVGQYTSYGKYRDTSYLDDWKKNYNLAMTAALEASYQNNLANLTKTYQNNYTDVYNQIGDIKNDYRNNIQELYDDTYMNNAIAMQQMANRGMTSSAQGVAMGTSGLMNASKQASNLAVDRDTLVNNVRTQLNRLTEAYNIDKDLLEKEFSLNKIQAMSDAELKYLEQMLDIDNINTNIYNSWAEIGAGNIYASEEAQKDREWQAKMAQEEYERQMALMAYQNSLYNRSYGGYSSGGGGGRYYTTGRTGYSSGGSGSGGSSGTPSDWVLDSDKLTADDNYKIESYIAKNPNATADQINAYAKSLISAKTQSKIDALTKPYPSAKDNAINAAINGVNSVLDIFR